MSDRTHISWSNATWNVATGCTRVSPGCLNCYIERTPPLRMAGRRFDRPGIGGTTIGGVRLHPERINQPMQWKKPRRVFVCSLADLFHDDVPDDYLAHVFAVMALARRHTFQVLTKRHGRMRSLLSRPDFRQQVSEEATNLLGSRAWQRWQLNLGTGWTVTRTTSSTSGGGNLWSPPWPLPNVWLGVSVENQPMANTRIPALLATPAAVRFLSCEPLLGPVDLRSFIGPHCPWCGNHIDPDPNEEYRAAEPKWQQRNPLRCAGCDGVGARDDWYPSLGDGIDWVIVGGESGPNARPMDPGWVHELQAECTAAGVAFHFKQAGSVLAREWGAHGNGSDPSIWPEAFPREYPKEYPA